MAKFLIDVNMPHKIRQWLNEDCIWQCEINLLASDTEIWENARKNNLIIITKDSDFSNRIFMSKVLLNVLIFIIIVVCCEELFV